MGGDGEGGSRPLWGGVWRGEVEWCGGCDRMGWGGVKWFDWMGSSVARC